MSEYYRATVFGKQIGVTIELADLAIISSL